MQEAVEDRGPSSIQSLDCSDGGLIATTKAIIIFVT